MWMGVFVCDGVSGLMTKRHSGLFVYCFHAVYPSVH